VLLVTADAFAPQRVPLPATDADNLQIVLQRFHFEGGELLGRVMSPAGQPVAGARVAMGVTSVVSDSEGTFGINLRRAGWPTAITAAKAGYSPARLELPHNGGKQREDWPAMIVLRLGPEPQKVRGRVVDQDQRGLAKAEVWIHDPTLLGIAGMLPLQVEYLIAGGEVPAQAARMRVPYADDPTQDGNFTDQASNVREPTACWFFATTDAEGNFELGGLLDRTYTLRALDPTSGLFGEVAGVTGGSFQQIEIEREVWPELRGRVLSRSGRPIADVRVGQGIVAYRANARVPGGRYEGTAMRIGARRRRARTARSCCATSANGTATSSSRATRSCRPISRPTRSWTEGLHDDRAGALPRRSRAGRSERSGPGRVRERRGRAHRRRDPAPQLEPVPDGDRDPQRPQRPVRRRRGRREARAAAQGRRRARHRDCTGPRSHDDRAVTGVTRAR
jgi:hypothetical protein